MFGDGMSPAVMKGGALIAVALLLGIFLLVKGTEGGESVEAASGPDVTAPPDTPTDGTAPPATGDDGGTTTTTEAPVDVDPSTVTVLVANASGLPGAAGTITTDLGSAGFLTSAPANATIVDDPAVTVIYFVGNQEAAGVAVAEALGLDADSVQPMPDPLPVDDMRGATVLVMLGTDLAPSA
jgi:hypothetical protein